MPFESRFASLSKPRFNLFQKEGRPSAFTKVAATLAAVFSLNLASPDSALATANFDFRAAKTQPLPALSLDEQIIRKQNRSKAFGKEYERRINASRLRQNQRLTSTPEFAKPQSTQTFSARPRLNKETFAKPPKSSSSSPKTRPSLAGASRKKPDPQPVLKPDSDTEKIREPQIKPAPEASFSETPLSIRQIPLVYTVHTSVKNLEILESGGRWFGRKNGRVYPAQPSASTSTPLIFSQSTYEAASAQVDSDIVQTFARAGDFSGLALLSPELAREYAKYTADTQEQAAVAAATLNWLRTQSAATNAAWWKAVEAARTDSTKPRSKTMEALVTTSYVFDLDPSKGLSLSALDEITAKLPVSQTETLFRANLHAAVRAYLELSPEQIAGVGNGTYGGRIANRINRVLSGNYPALRTSQALRDFYLELEEFNRQARAAKPESGAHATLIKRSQALIEQQLPPLYEASEYLQTANELADLTGGQERMQVVANDKDGEVLLNTTAGEVSGTIDYRQAREKWSLNLLETAFQTALSGFPNLSFTHEERAQRITAQAGGLQKLEALLETHKLDGSRRKKVTRLLPAEAKRGLTYLTYLTPFVPALRQFVPPAFYNQIEVQASGGNSTPLYVPPAFPQTYEAALVDFANLIPKRGQLTRLLDRGVVPNQALSEVTGLSGKSLESVEALLLLGSNFADSPVRPEGDSTYFEVTELAQKYREKLGQESAATRTHPYIPNLTVASALVVDTDSGRARLDIAETPAARQALRENRHRSYLEASRRNLVNFKFFYEAFKRDGRASYRNFDITPQTTFLGIPAVDLLTAAQSDSTFASALDVLFNSVQFSEAMALEEQYDSRQRTNLSFRLGTNTASREIESAGVTLTQSTTAAQGRFSSQGETTVQTAYLEETTYYLLHRFEVLARRANLLKTNQVGISDVQKNVEGRGNFRVRHTSRDVISD